MACSSVQNFFELLEAAKLETQEHKLVLEHVRCSLARAPALVATSIPELAYIKGLKEKNCFTGEIFVRELPREAAEKYAAENNITIRW